MSRVALVVVPSIRRTGRPAPLPLVECRNGAVVVGVADLDPVVGDEARGGGVERRDAARSEVRDAVGPVLEARLLPSQRVGEAGAAAEGRLLEDQLGVGEDGRDHVVEAPHPEGISRPAIGRAPLGAGTDDVAGAGDRRDGGADPLGAGGAERRVRPVVRARADGAVVGSRPEGARNPPGGVAVEGVRGPHGSPEGVAVVPAVDELARPRQLPLLDREVEAVVGQGGRVADREVGEVRGARPRPAVDPRGPSPLVGEHRAREVAPDGVQPVVVPLAVEADRRRGLLGAVALVDVVLGSRPVDDPGRTRRGRVIEVTDVREGAEEGPRDPHLAPLGRDAPGQTLIVLADGGLHDRDAPTNPV